MTTFGHYSTQVLLHKKGLNSVYSARSAARPDKEFAVKVFQLPSFLEEETRNQAEAFLDSAKVQQKVASTGARYWAPVYEQGSAPDGSYYATDKYACSAEELINGHVKLSAGALHNIVTSVVNGLLELKKALGRPHGNLTPGNILISQHSDLPNAEVVLCDPAAGRHLDPEVHWAADVRDVAELIYQLVTFSSSPMLEDRQIPNSEQWRALGKNSDDWRSLCSRLISATLRPGEISLEHLAEAIPSPPPPSIIASRRARIAAITCAAVMIPAVCLIIYGGDIARWYYRRPCEEAWLKNLRDWAHNNPTAVNVWKKQKNDTKLKTFCDDLVATAIVPSEKRWKEIKNGRDKCRVVKEFLKEWQNQARKVKEELPDPNWAVTKILDNWIAGTSPRKQNSYIGPNVNNIYVYANRLQKDGLTVFADIRAKRQNLDNAKKEKPRDANEAQSYEVKIAEIERNLSGIEEHSKLESKITDLSMLYVQAKDAVMLAPSERWAQKKNMHFDDPIIDTLWTSYLYALHKGQNLSDADKLRSFVQSNIGVVETIERKLADLKGSLAELFPSDPNYARETWRTQLRSIYAQYLPTALGIGSPQDINWVDIYKTCEKLKETDPNRTFAEDLEGVASNINRNPRLPLTQLCGWKAPAEEVITQVKDWRYDMNELATDVNAVEDNLDNWYTYADSNEIKAIYDEPNNLLTGWTEGIKAGAKRDVQDAIKLLTQRVQTLRKIAESRDRSELNQRTIEFNDGAAIYALYLQWGKFSPPWPKDANENASVSQIARRLKDQYLTPLQFKGNEKRRQDLQELVENGLNTYATAFDVQQKCLNLRRTRANVEMQINNLNNVTNLNEYPIFAGFRDYLATEYGGANKLIISVQDADSNTVSNYSTKVEDANRSLSVLSKTATDVNNLLTDLNRKGTTYYKDKIKDDMIAEIRTLKKNKQAVDANTVTKWIKKIPTEYLKKVPENGDTTPGTDQSSPRTVPPVGFEAVPGMEQELVGNRQKYIQSKQDRTVVLQLIKQPTGPGTAGFYMAVHEISNAQYGKKDGKPDDPVTGIKYEDANKWAKDHEASLPLIREYSDAIKSPDNNQDYHLRGEAWKQAAGKYEKWKNAKPGEWTDLVPEVPYTSADQVTELSSARIDDSRPTQDGWHIRSVGSSGDLRLHDVIGNVWEWTQDLDPRDPGKQKHKIWGASCLSDPYTYDSLPQSIKGGIDIGFRVVVRIGNP